MCLHGETIIIDRNNIVVNIKYLILRLWIILWNYEYISDIDLFTFNVQGEYKYLVINIVKHGCTFYYEQLYNGK